MKFALVTLGSAGDLHPFLAVARALSRRGHDVCLMSQAPFQAEVEAEGVRFLSICDARHHQRTLQHPDLWHPVRGLGVLWRHLCVPAIGPTLDRLTDWLNDVAQPEKQPPIVLASPLAVGGRLFKENQGDGIRLYTVATAPTSLRSIADPMFLGPWHVPPAVPMILRRSLWGLLDRWKLEPMAQPAVRAWRRRLNLTDPLPSIFGRWLPSPDGVLALFPADFCPARRDWPQPAVQFGFPLYEPVIDIELPPAAKEFLATGRPPWVLYLGSAAHLRREEQDRIGLLVQQLLNRRQRVIGLGPAAAELVAANSLTDTDGVVLTLPWAPLGKVLRCAAAFVHHGGIGSCAQALVSHTPQLILASAYDQQLNGQLVQQQGAGQWLDLRRVSSRAWRQAVQKVLNGPSFSKILDTDLAAPGKIDDVCTSLSGEMPGHSDSKAVQDVCDWLTLRPG